MCFPVPPPGQLLLAHLGSLELGLGDSLSPQLQTLHFRVRMEVGTESAPLTWLSRPCSLLLPPPELRNLPSPFLWLPANVHRIQLHKEQSFFV